MGRTPSYTIDYNHDRLWSVPFPAINQPALAYEGESERLTEKLGMESSVEEVFRRAQATFNEWSKLPPEERTASAILSALEIEFFELLDSVTIARSPVGQATPANRGHYEHCLDAVSSVPDRHVG